MKIQTYIIIMLNVIPSPPSLSSWIIVYEEGNMSAAALKNGGLSLVTQCLCEWVLKEKIKPGMMFSISERNRKGAFNEICRFEKIF